jgi:hypothetical protein
MIKPVLDKAIANTNAEAIALAIPDLLTMSVKNFIESNSYLLGAEVNYFLD